MSVNTSVNPNQNGSVSKLTINLLQPELLPEKVLLTLPRVVAVWCLVLFIMLGWVVKTNYTQHDLKEQLTVLQQENSKYTNQQSTLTTQLAARKVDRKLSDKLVTLKLLMNNKQALHAKLTNPNATYVAGFAGAMDDLAQLHHQDIRLEAININNDDMTFSGLALTPEAVPAWLAGFENSALLSGKYFSHFKLSENEQHITKFMVSSKDEKVPTYE
tara:strand:+ start:10037 stop:10684 length:648 start_codon:yes stop_codon:yes gene_type:complete